MSVNRVLQRIGRIFVSLPLMENWSPTTNNSRRGVRCSSYGAFGHKLSRTELVDTKF